MAGLVGGLANHLLPEMNFNPFSDQIISASNDLTQKINNLEIDERTVTQESKEAMDTILKSFLVGKDIKKIGVAQASKADGTLCWLCKSHFYNEPIRPPPLPLRSNVNEPALPNQISPPHFNSHQFQQNSPSADPVQGNNFITQGIMSQTPQKQPYSQQQQLQQNSSNAVSPQGKYFIN